MPYKAMRNSQRIPPQTCMLKISVLLCHTLYPSIAAYTSHYSITSHFLCFTPYTPHSSYILPSHSASYSQESRAPAISVCSLHSDASRLSSGSLSKIVVIFRFPCILNLQKWQVRGQTKKTVNI